MSLSRAFQLLQLDNVMPLAVEVYLNYCYSSTEKQSCTFALTISTQLKSCSLTLFAKFAFPFPLWTVATHTDADTEVMANFEIKKMEHSSNISTIISLSPGCKTRGSENSMRSEVENFRRPHDLKVKLYEVIESDRHVYLVMEFAANVPVSHLRISRLRGAYPLPKLSVGVCEPKSHLAII
ncbi:hypothetical protein ACTXT7_000393 [Hymenolepis weldensis]